MRRDRGCRQRAKLRNGWKGRAAKLSREAAGPNPLLIKGDEWSVSQTLSWRLCQSKLRPALRVCIHVSGCPGDKERLSGGESVTMSSFSAPSGQTVR